MQEPNQAREIGTPGGAANSSAVERDKADLAESEALGGRVQAAAADLTQCEAAFLTLLGEFDAAHASRWWDGIGSTAQWLAWACSIAPVTAREHVRVARALRTLPVIAEAFGRGELSYSKVRTLTRMTGRYKQEKLLQLARAATAAQLARTVSSYRAVSGSHAEREERTRVSWSNRPDGLIQITAVLLPEDGAAVIAALEEATDQNRDDARNTCPGTEINLSGDDAAGGDGPDGKNGKESTASGNAEGDLSQAQLEVPRDHAESREEIARRSRVSALVGVFQHWLGSRPEDRSGADQTTVVIEVDAAELANSFAAQTVQTTGAADSADAHKLIAPSVTEVKAPGASAEAPQPPAVPAIANTGAGESDSDIVNTGASAEAFRAATALPEPHPTPTPTTGTCHVRGHTGLEPDTARRLACEANVHAIIRGLDGEPLAVSRSKRFGTRGQRRALMLRDKHCQFPGCARQRNLKIHHVDHWIDGGTTDLTNLMLLCQFHHTAVHEGHLTITANTGPIRWRFQRPDGSVIVPEVVGLRFEQTLPLLDDGFGGILPDGPACDAAEERRRQLITENRQHRQKVQAQQATLVAAYDDIESGDDPRARRSFPVGGGGGFILGNCVEVLFDCELPDPATADDEGEPLDLAA